MTRRKQGRDAEDVRDELARLRAELTLGKIDVTEHAHQSARLLHELKRLETRRKPYALT